MLSLINDQLDVTILDPAADQARLGSRYCSGGYVYAVADRQRGVITSGPGYPDEEPPPVFDGQGLPEAFHSWLWTGMDPDSPSARPPAGTLVLVIGVGTAKAPPPQEREMPVDEYCRWQVREGPGRVLMETRQSFAGWALELRREVRLRDRTLFSETWLANVGQDPIAFRWFAHPFFPNPGGACCKFNVAVTVADNPGYELGDDGFLRMKLDHEWDRRGHFLALPFTPPERLVTLQKHPTLGLLAATCSFIPSFLPIWGNRNTFSFEPYHEQTVAPGADTTWSITYDF
jgi:hypothetical protein